MIDTKDIAWAAGFLEGEGSFGTTGAKSIRITCPQKQKEPLLRLQKLFGGNLAWRQDSIWVWYINGSAAAGVMMTLLVFMSPKRTEEIIKALDVWKSARTIGTKGSKYCIHGHDMDVTGRYYTKGRKGPRCAECSRQYSRRSAAKRRAAKSDD